jgi:hypothetical protein
MQEKKLLPIETLISFDAKQINKINTSRSLMDSVETQIRKK